VLTGDTLQNVVLCISYFPEHVFRTLKIYVVPLKKMPCITNIQNKWKIVYIRWYFSI